MDNQQIKARFFGMHIGCKFQFENNGTLHDHVVTGVYSNITGWHVGTTDGPVDMDVCKLILRPLSSITLQEFTDFIISIREDGESDDDIREAARIVFPEILEHEFILTDEKAIWFDYLRSINICVPFMGLDPVKEGWAVLSE